MFSVRCNLYLLYSVALLFGCGFSLLKSLCQVKTETLISFAKRVDGGEGLALFSSHG